MLPHSWLAHAHDCATGLSLPPCYRKHDYLKDLIGHHANFHLNLQFRSSMDSLAALSRGECLLAGFHVSEYRAPGTLAQKVFKRGFKPGKHKLINFVTRR